MTTLATHVGFRGDPTAAAGAIFVDGAFVFWCRRLRHHRATVLVGRLAEATGFRTGAVESFFQVELLVGDRAVFVVPFPKFVHVRRSLALATHSSLCRLYL